MKRTAFGLGTLLALLGLADSAAAGPDHRLARLDGKGSVALSSLTGRVVVLDFWATWCEPCKRSLPRHAELAKRYGDRLAVLAVSLDEKPETAARFVARLGLALDFYADPSGRLAEVFGVTAMPYAVVIDAKGEVVERIAGEPYPRLEQAIATRLGAASGCAGGLEREATAMGTRVHLRLCPNDAVPAAALVGALDDAFAELARLEALWSTWVPDSDLSRINRAAGGEAVPVAPETYDVLARALAGSARSGGLFDVSFAPLGELWSFDTPPGALEPTRLRRVPSPAEIAERRALVSYQDVALDPVAGTVRLARAGMKLHLGGIGKGAAVDRVVARLRARGLTSFFVQAGGDLYCAGKNGERPWSVGIAHPRRPGEVLGGFAIEDAAFSTSGDYERFAIVDGRRYHHLIDVRTGYPGAASQSATVKAKTATDAEILTKVAFLVGGDAGIRAVEREGAEALIVDAGGAIFASRGLVVGGAR